MPYRGLLIGEIMYTCFKYAHISTLSRKQMRKYERNAQLVKIVRKHVKNYHNEVVIQEQLYLIAP
jgi:hypothetical protein